MATSLDFAEYVAGQLAGLGSVSYKKMFGEYMIYINSKPIFLLCDNTVFIKRHEILQTLLSNADKGIPYNGAKEHYVVDVESRELLEQIVELVEPLVQVPKPRKKSVEK